MAYRGADLLWSRPITSTCNNASLGVWKLMNGADGNVYGTASAYTPCGPQNAVFGISAATGALLFINRSATAYELVGTHRRGLVATYGDDSEGVRFLDYRGHEYGRVKVVGSAKEMAQRLAGNPDGQVFAYLTDRAGTTTRPDCAAYYAVNRIEILNTSGRTGRYTLTRTAAEREAYANDLGDDRALIAVSAASNRSKADQDPTTWLPPTVGYRCQYVTDWIADKIRWGLSIDAAEHTALSDVLDACPNVPVTVTTAR
ncbi:hypothetical protein ABZT16_34730 [Streptomyces flaveolus]|uniref:hypothetical protein n=1 Tax=Streptomyces flaveolus TaxID=67297 RepID=UPI0033AA1E59